MKKLPDGWKARFSGGGKFRKWVDRGDGGSPDTYWVERLEGGKWKLTKNGMVLCSTYRTATDAMEAAEKEMSK